MVVCDTFWKRLRGAYGRDISNGLLLVPCRMVHTFFLFRKIRVAYLDENGDVLLDVHLSPFSVGPYIANAAAVLEYPAGTCLSNKKLLETAKKTLVTRTAKKGGLSHDTIK